MSAGDQGRASPTRGTFAPFAGTLAGPTSYGQQPEARDAALTAVLPVEESGALSSLRRLS